MTDSFGNRTANRWARKFLRSLRREVRKALPGRERNVSLETAKVAHALYAARADALPDRQAHWITALCALVLAAYRQLLSEAVTPEDAYQTVRRAFFGSFQTSMKIVTRALLWVLPDPMAVLSRFSLKRAAERTYGTTMAFDQHVGPGRMELIVTRCAFNQFFLENGEPSLTRIFCEGDRVWMDEVDRSRRPIRTERPSTISTGAERCEFRFVQDSANPRQSPRDIIIDSQEGKR